MTAESYDTADAAIMRHCAASATVTPAGAEAP